MEKKNHYFTVDGHSDYPIKVYMDHLDGKKGILVKEHLPLLMAGGVNLEVCTVGGDFSMMGIDLSVPNVVFGILEGFQNEMLKGKDLLAVKDGSDLDMVASGKKTGFLFSLEGAGAIKVDIELLRAYYDKGLRSVILVHNGRNQVGCGSENECGLTDFGRELIRRMNEMNVVIDLAHSSKKTFWDAMELIDKPPVVSHSNARAIRDHPRNLTDEQIEAVGEKNGVIGLNFLAWFADKDVSRAGPDRLLDHLDHIVSHSGIRNVGLGPDFAYYYMDALEDWVRKNGHPPELLRYVKGLEDHTRLPILVELLEKRGYSSREVGMIMGGNLLDVYRRIL